MHETNSRYNGEMNEVTIILSAMEQGDPSAADRLLPAVYDELRQLATAKLAREKAGHSLQPTMLVHEAYLRLVDVDDPQQFNSRGHFFGAAAEAMRRILVERARQKRSRKRGAGLQRMPVDDLAIESPDHQLDLLDLDDALSRFEEQWPEKAKLVKLRYFVGFTTAEAANALGMSLRTAERTWTFAKAWLLNAIDGDD